MKETIYPSKRQSLFSDNLANQPLFADSPSAVGGNPDHLFGMMVQQLQPFFRRIVRRQHLALMEFGIDGP